MSAQNSPSTPSDQRAAESAPAVSVVVPCYNYGAYLNEAVDSVLAQTCQDFEIVVVNDGSTEPATVALLANYDRPKTHVIHTANQGLALARNAGIAASRGRYILPLDADDRIGPVYLAQALKILEADPNIGIVYCQAEFFGAVSGPWELPPYSFPEILLDNSIFCTAMFRRADWAAVGGYNPNMTYGWEDYDFWLSLIELGRGVVQIPEVLFFYRKHTRSMTGELDKDRFVFLYSQLFRNHPKLYAENVGVLFGERYDLRAKLFHAERLLKLMNGMGYWKLRHWWKALKGW
jgi:glycosyltransferase involved in cell wall biosynthesis